MNFENFYNCLTSKKEEYRKMNTIRSYKHKIYSEEVNKKALGAFDKRFIIPRHEVEGG